MPSKAHAKRLRQYIEQGATALTDAEALEAVELFPPWKPDTDYTKGQRVREDGLLYRLIPETHHSQSEWPPHMVPAVWARVDDPGEEWPEWRQPLGAEDAYSAGAKVSHQGKHWVNSHGDGNVWEPGVYGWQEQPESNGGGEESDASVRSVEWHQCPEAVREYLANTDYTGVAYTESVIENYAPSHCQGEIPDNPIAYNGNMALENGKYYSQFGVIYICVRDTINPVYANLADLIGLYVQVWTG